MTVVELAAGTQRQRVLDGVLRCIARWGMAKTTLEDIAREAGCSRATVYRLFPGGKDSILEALIEAEVTRFFGELADRIDGVGPLEELLVVGMTYAATVLAEHGALQYLLAHEPELVLPRLSFHQLDEVLLMVSGVVGPYLAPHVGADEAPRAAEWLTRVVLSYALCPSATVDLRDPESTRRLVRTYLIPGLTRTVHHEHERTGAI